MTRFLSGVQPSGLPHLGNYFGAIQQHIALQSEGEAFFFIADFHALTTVHDREKLHASILELAVTYLALGLDPARTVFWRQSAVPEVTEITWLLATVTGLGLLERGHSFKDKVQRGIKPTAGLFNYPLLMAADILSFDTDLVPVGQDQVQHVEMTQDMAGYFNNTYGKEVFKRPEWRLSKTPRVLGLDGEKMSKSHSNFLWIFEEGKRLKKMVGRIPTDSRPPEEPKEPDELLIFQWLQLFLDEEEYAGWCQRARTGGAQGPGYGDLKKRLVAALETRFKPAREERRRLLADPAHVAAILEQGAKRARQVACSVRDRAYRACGIL